jgi:hypothetical protein
MMPRNNKGLSKSIGRHTKHYTYVVRIDSAGPCLAPSVRDFVCVRAPTSLLLLVALWICSTSSR